MADKLTIRQIEEFREAFNRFDSDKDGRLTVAELRYTLRLFRLAPEPDIAKLVAASDANASGAIELNEFLELVAHALKNTNPDVTLRRAFETYDLDGDGHITARELKQVVARMNGGMSDAEVDAWISASDKDADGTVSFVEFLEMMAEE